MYPPRTLLHRPFATLLCALGVGIACAAPPQTVYRCGPEGRTYSQTPCQDGQAVSVEDSRSAAQQRAARDVAEREQRSASKLAKEREQREAAVKGQQAIGIKPEAATVAASAPVRKAKAGTEQGNLSPLMRVPSTTAASK